MVTKCKMIEQNDMMHAIEVEVHHEIIIITKMIVNKTDTVLHLETVLVMTKVLLLLDHAFVFYHSLVYEKE